jgi:GT2 family glycosyltransferase
VTSPTGGKRPKVSVLLCAYRDERTVARSLTGFARQTYRPLELVMVDSSPDQAVEDIVRTRFPGVRYVHHPERLLPNEAHARAVDLSDGELLIFSDPDIYAPADWVERLVGGWRQTGAPVCGSLRCHGRRWMDLGMHLAKFDQQLPVPPERWIEIGPTSVLLCPRDCYRQTGGFIPGLWLADTVMSWRLSDIGHPIWFLPSALAEHHHHSSWGGFVQERFNRAKEFGLLRSSRMGWAWWDFARLALISALPLRLAGLMLRSARASWRSGRRLDAITTLPVVASGHAAWLAGELVTYVQRLVGAHPTNEG